MVTVATYVFLDVETTGLPKQENNLTRITELSLIAVKRDHVLDTRPGASPRVQHKLTLCFNPGRYIQPTCTVTTGLSNELLEFEPFFNMEVFSLISNFLKVLSKPVCLISQNGISFDFPILKNHLVKLKVSFEDDLLCADSLHAFWDVLHEKKTLEKQYIQMLPQAAAVVTKTSKNMNTAEKGSSENQCNKTETCAVQTETNVSENEDFDAPNTLQMQSTNQKTPDKKAFSKNFLNKKKDDLKNNENKVGKAKSRRSLFYGNSPKPKESFKLKDIYERLLNRPAIEAHRAENDCIMALESSIAIAKEFVEWIDENALLFTEINAMQVGVEVGLLVLTGLLWGCTNPFIKAGTQGLRDVRGNSAFDQALAEVTFLLGNWKYTVPFLVNQLGSLSYFLAVRAAPLSVAVPTANALAFAFTAITAAVCGREDKLDSGSILGIVFIVAGIALCCWDKTE